MVGGHHWPAAAGRRALLCPDWVTVIVVCGIAAAAAYELLHTAERKCLGRVYAFTILAAVAQEWVIYDAHTWQFYDSYQSVGMIRILCVPLALVTVLFFVAVKGYGTPNAMPFADVATAMMGGTVFHDVQRHFPAADGRAVRQDVCTAAILRGLSGR